MLTKIKKKINLFLKIDLCLQIKKSSIYIKNSKPIFFLDFYIKFITKLKKISFRKKIILNYKKKYINKIAFLNKKIINNFKTILTQIIYEHFVYVLNPLKIYKKWSSKLLNRKLWSFIKFNIMLQNFKNYILINISTKQKIHKKESVSLNWFLKIFELLPISKSKIHSYLINAELCKLKNKFLYNLEKLQTKLFHSYFEIKKKSLFSIKEKTIYYINLKKKKTIQNIFNFQNYSFVNKLHKNNQKLLNIFAPIKKILNQFKFKKFFQEKTLRFKSNKLLIFLQDFEIVKYYRQIIQFLLNYYGSVNNYNNIKIIISQLKLSCIYTLAFKHNKTAHWVTLYYGENCQILNKNNNKITIELPTNWFINVKIKHYNKFLTCLNLLYTTKKSKLKYLRTNTVFNILFVVIIKKNKYLKKSFKNVNKKLIFFYKQYLSNLKVKKYTKTNINFYKEIYIIKVFDNIILKNLK